MRVLRVSHSAVVTAWRGRERALRARGVTVRTLSARRWAEGGRDVDLAPQPGEDVVGVATAGRHPHVFLYDPRPIWRALGEEWDVLDLHEEPAALATAEILLLRALRRNRTPYVLYSAQNLAKRYPPPFRWWERRALRGAGAVSVCNAEAGDVLRAKGLTVPAHVIGLGVDVPRLKFWTDRPRPADPPRGAPRPSGTTSGASTDADVAGAHAPACTGYVGRLIAPHKGLDVLLDAAEIDPRLHVAIAGAGPHEAALRRRAATPALAGRVTFHGHLTGADLAAFYAGLDVLAVPSVPAPGWLEQFGRVAVEAMASGVPVVASDSGALRDVVGGTGILVPPGDARALAGALAVVLDDPRRAAALRAAGLARAADYTWDAIADAYLTMYTPLTTPPPPAPPPTPPTPPPAPSTARGRGFAWFRSAETPDLDTKPPTSAGSAAGVGGLEVVVVAFGAAGLLAEALAPVAGELAVTVVDNSGDADVRAVAEAAGVRYLDPGANLGFGAAVDVVLGDRLCPGADLLLLNPDARIDVAGVRALHRRLHAEPDVAAVGPAQADASGAPARVLWPFPTPAGVWRQEAGLGLRAIDPHDDPRGAGHADGHRGRRGSGHTDRTGRTGRTDTGFVIGSVLLLRAQALAEVGGFDEAFFLYSEETDWQRRARDAGWRSVVAGDALARHVGGGTSTDPTRRETHFHASQERYFRKHHGTRGWSMVRTAVVLGSMARSPLPGDRGRAARLRLRLYLRGPLRAEAALGDPRAPRTPLDPATDSDAPGATRTSAEREREAA